MNDTQDRSTHAVRRVAAAFAEASGAADPEAALAVIGRLACEVLGDPEAASRPGALKPGESNFSIAGYFIVRPGRRDMLLVAEIGWPPEQHRLIIDIDEGRPGSVVAGARPLVLPNTDQDGTFTQILSSARMGSSLYAPLVWQGEVLGLITVASQARYTYSADDLPLLEVAAAHAAALWVALGGGPGFLENAAAGRVLPRDRPGR